MRTIGLTGVMGAGKSSVIRILQEEGITVLDCDAVNAQLLQKQEEGYTALIQMFGTDILNDEGNIMPQRMSDLIFCLKLYRHISKEEALRRLRHQLPQQEKIKRADVVFYNNSDSASLKRQICDILNMKRQLR